VLVIGLGACSHDATEPKLASRVTKMLRCICLFLAHSCPRLALPHVRSWRKRTMGGGRGIPVMMWWTAPAPGDESP
jgi:hypothetical protein